MGRLQFLPSARVSKQGTFLQSGIWGTAGCWCEFIRFQDVELPSTVALFFVCGVEKLEFCGIFSIDSSPILSALCIVTIHDFGVWCAMKRSRVKTGTIGYMVAHISLLRWKSLKWGIYVTGLAVIDTDKVGRKTSGVCAGCMVLRDTDLWCKKGYKSGVVVISNILLWIPFHYDFINRLTCALKSGSLLILNRSEGLSGT